MPAIPRDSPPRPVLAGLERELLRRLASGSSMRQAAEDLHYSYAYLREVRAAALAQLGAHTLGQALYLAGYWRLF
jgi:FixJ family two-component response regulator